MAIFRCGPPPDEALNAGTVGKNRDLDEYLARGSMTAAVRKTTATVYGTDRHASVNICLSQLAWTTREQNII